METLRLEEAGAFSNSASLQMSTLSKSLVQFGVGVSAGAMPYVQDPPLRAKYLTCLHETDMHVRSDLQIKVVVTTTIIRLTSSPSNKLGCYIKFHLTLCPCLLLPCRDPLQPRQYVG
jgi:hypothetical protein